MQIIWIPNADISLVKPMDKPFGIECGNVGSLTGIDNHGYVFSCTGIDSTVPNIKRKCFRATSAKE